VLLEDPPDRRGADAVAEFEQLALDVESAWGAVAGFPWLRFPRPVSKPDVRLSPHPALHRIHAAGSMFSVGQAHVRCTVPVVMLAPLFVDVAETRRRYTDRICVMCSGRAQRSG
jgi:hypothetical protein